MKSKNTSQDQVILLLMSLFLGWLGIDRFMMGQVFLGILKLITFGGIGIWWLIDVILIATKKMPGVTFK